MGRTKRANDSTAEASRPAKSTKVDSGDAATSKKPASKAVDKPASKAKATDKPVSKAKAKAPASKAKPAGKAKAKAISADEFKSKALPLHVSLTRTPPKLDESKEGEAESSDPGFLASIALQPSTFGTGSYGWKGSRRLTIPITDADGETVTVMININATVAGSKGASTAKKEDPALSAEENVASGSGSD